MKADRIRPLLAFDTHPSLPGGGPDAPSRVPVADRTSLPRRAPLPLACASVARSGCREHDLLTESVCPASACCRSLLVSQRVEPSPLECPNFPIRRVSRLLCSAASSPVYCRHAREASERAEAILRSGEVGRGSIHWLLAFVV